MVVPSGPECEHMFEERKGRMERESLRLLLAQGLSVEKIARPFGKHPSTVSYWMGKHGLDAPNRDKHAARGEHSRGRRLERRWLERD